MEKDLEKYYNNRFDLFTSNGWRDLIEDVKIMRDNYADIKTINDEKHLNLRKGQLDILDWMLDLENLSNLTYKELQE